MKIAIIGYGKMGKLVEKVSKKRGHDIVSIIDSLTTNDNISDADVCIEFTEPDAVLDNIEIIASHGKNLVIGTTGWYDKIDNVAAIIDKTDTGAIYSPNFSVGVNLFMDIVSHAAELINQYPEYDVAGVEYHHKNKADSPSGTAKAIANALIEKIERKKIAEYNVVDRVIKPEELHFTSVRCGATPGTHTVIYDSEADTITITHTARNREGFALGAVLAAEWIQNKKGFYDGTRSLHSVNNAIQN